LDAVQDDGVIVVHSGVYDEQLSISKPVAIIGAAKNEADAVVIQYDSSTVVTFNPGSVCSFLGHLTLMVGTALLHCLF